MSIDLSKEVGKILETYGDDVKEAVKEAVPKVAKGAVKKLRHESPSRTGKYAKGWTQKTESDRLGTSATVYGGKNTYPLAHLLEHGHAKRGGGRVNGITHIAPVEEWATEELEKEIKEAVK